ncbi:ATP/GTP-binding protein [Streptomyces sp. NPDC050204]|uniref:GTP-binding protein n=1 Tax=Streptomyces sp. NPDC050204 TaxID=3155514 RepID=UPI0034452228
MMNGDEISVKILIAGHFSAGKTTFVTGLSEIRPLSTEEVMTSVGEGIDHTDRPGKTTTTVAMDFGRLHLDDRRVLYLFGAPGQERYFPVLQDLAHGALGAVVLTGTSRLEETYPILELIERLQLPHLVAVNIFDNEPLHTEARLREVMDLADGTPLVTCDARNPITTRRTLATLVRHLIALTPEPVR